MIETPEPSSDESDSDFQENNVFIHLFLFFALFWTNFIFICYSFMIWRKLEFIFVASFLNIKKKQKKKNYSWYIVFLYVDCWKILYTGNSRLQAENLEEKEGRCFICISSNIIVQIYIFSWRNKQFLYNVQTHNYDILGF